MRKFLANESGTETVEWGIMAGLIVAGLVAIVAAIGTWVSGRMGQIQTELGA